MAVQAKELIREAESSGFFLGLKHAVVRFMAPDVDIVLKSLIQSLQQSLVPIFNQLITSEPGFPPRFPSYSFGGFSTPADNFSSIDRFSSLFPYRV